MRSTAPFAVSAAPAETGHDMNAGAAYTVETYTEGSPFVPETGLSSNYEAVGKTLLSETNTPTGSLSFARL